jgi:hypothetical protein
MSKRTLLNLVMLAAVGILVLVVVYEPGLDQQTKTTLTSIDKTTISQVKVERTGQATVTLVKSADNWVMQAPYKISANKIKVESLLTLLEQETFAQYPLKDLDIKTYGLDIPRATLTFNDKERFEFGGTEPLNKRRYLRYNDTMYVINDHFYYQLMSPVTTFVNHKVLPDSDNITRLVLPDFSLTLKDGTWDMAPKKDDVSNDRANELVENWRLSHAMSIMEYDGKSGQKQAEVYLDNTPTPIVFHILIDNDNVFLGRPDIGIKYQIIKDKGFELLKLPAKLDIPANATPAPATPDTPAAK